MVNNMAQQTRVMRGPGPGPRGHMGKGADMKSLLPVLKRVLGYMLKNYTFPFFMVVVCIVGSALATLR